MSVISSGLKTSQKKRFVGSVDITIHFNANLSRFSSQFDKAQEYLDETVLRDSNKFAPALNKGIDKHRQNNAW